jgi:hypothetical protein
MAEEMAKAASQEFNAFESRQRLAQADGAKPGKAGPAPQAGGAWHWLQDSRERFQALMRRLAGEGRTVRPWDPVEEAGRKSSGQQPGKTVETTKADEAPAPAAAPVKPGAVAGVKPPAEERKLAETRRAEPDKHAAEPKGKAPAKTDPARPAEAPKPADARPRAADAKPAAEATKPPAPKTAEALAKAQESPKAAAPEMKKADAPNPPAAAQSAKREPTAPNTPGAAPKPTSATPPAPPPAKQEAAAPKSANARPEPGAKQPEPGKQPGIGGKVAANEPAAVKTDIPSGIPTTPEAKPRRARVKGKGATRPRPAAACRYAGRRVNPGNWYTVREGDSLWRIARRHLGSGETYRMLRAANRRAIADADLIRPCQRIYIPRRGARQRS